jgi:lipoteichoic acid synthase
MKSEACSSLRRLSSHSVLILSTGVALSLVCMFIRMQMLFYGFNSASETWWTIRTGFWSSYVDLIVVWSVAILVMAALPLVPGSQRARWAAAFSVFAAASVVLACINSAAVRMLGGSLTFQWLYYADLLRSFTPRSAIAPALNVQAFLILLASIAALLIVSRGLARILTRANKAGWLAFAIVPWLALVVAFVVYAERQTDQSADGEGKTTNPWVELVVSAVAAPSTDLHGIRDLPDPVELPPPSNSAETLSGELRQGSIRNVVLIVMESVGARYIAGRRSEEAARWTPQIARYRDTTLSFQNIYANTPMSTKSLYSLLTAIYPEFTYEIETSLFAGKHIQTLSNRLKQAGFRTAIFMSGDMQFQSVDTFLEGKGFDHFADRRNIRCDIAPYLGSTVEWPNLDSIDDSCTSKAMTDWIDAGGDRPFFAMMWTGNTHWPYFFPKSDNQLVSMGDPYKDRYLKALQASDASVGHVLAHLETQGLLESTLVVILGDHGEAFGEHGRRIHGTDIYDEQTHIPLLVINSNIVQSNSSVLGGMIDVAPTILHLLGLPPENRWEGRSLFDPHRSERVFLFAPNQEMVAGYREGTRKYIYRMSRKEALVFDLATDPQETMNLADKDTKTLIRRNLAAWLRDRKRPADANSSRQR